MPHRLWADETHLLRQHWFENEHSIASDNIGLPE
jgi:hypothetical protein